MKRLIECLNKEVESAKVYAGCYVEYRAKGDGTTAAKFWRLSMAALNQANTLDEIGISETAGDLFDKAHAEYIAAAEWVRNILAM